MTPEQYTAAKAKLNELDTTSAELRRNVEEGIEAARRINGSVRLAQSQQRAVDVQANELRAAIREYDKAQREAAIAEAKMKAAEVTPEAAD